MAFGNMQATKWSLLSVSDGGRRRPISSSTERAEPRGPAVQSEYLNLYADMREILVDVVIALAREHRLCKMSPATDRRETETSLPRAIV
jgi:hypothetical protein